MPQILKNIITISVIFCFLPCLAWSKSSAKNNSNFSLVEDSEFESFETTGAEKIDDPLEKYNRKIYAFNDSLDRHFLEPVAKTYHDLVPHGVRISIHNFLTNLASPLSAVNSLLQGKVDNSLATLSNFLINSTIGVGGLFDVAGQKGVFYRHEDFSQTLGHYGVSSGAYLMLPVFGPSSARDLGGLAVDKSVDPLGFNFLKIGGAEGIVDANYRLALGAIGGIDTRESLLDILDDIRKDSFDPYATIRSAYLQKRSTEVKN